MWNIGVKKLLSEGYWNFAQKIVQLGLDTDNYEIQKYKYKYYLPADLATIYSIYSKNSSKVDYTIVGKFLYANEFPVDCRYISSDLDDTYPAHFADCLAYWLGSELCGALGATDRQPVLIQKLEAAKQAAKVINGKDIPSAEYDNSYYTRSRY
jgi:hypothetical protein